MTYAITLAEARHRLESLALHQPDKVAGGDAITCRYFEYDGSPSCLVGHAFAEELKTAGIVFGTWENEDGINSRSILEKISIEPDAVTYLSIAQEQQDFGQTWGDAVKLADERIDSVLAERTAQQSIPA